MRIAALISVLCSPARRLSSWTGVTAADEVQPVSPGCQCRGAEGAGLPDLPSRARRCWPVTTSCTASMKDRDMGYLVETTGKYPALIEFEGGIFARKYHEDYSTPSRNSSCKTPLPIGRPAVWSPFAGTGAIHLEPVNSYPNTKIEFDIEAALTEGTPEHEAMIKDLDVTAEMLKALRDAHVPVLWRPLHEICGGWFWWSMQSQENAEEALALCLHLLHRAPQAQQPAVGLLILAGNAHRLVPRPGVYGRRRRRYLSRRTTGPA